MNNNEYYAVVFRILQQSYFTIWVSSEDEDFFLTAENYLLFFLTRNELYDFCKVSAIQIEAETSFDFDSIDYEDCNVLIDLWNISSDLAKTLNLLFIGDMDNMIGIYKKLLYGCNLPALNNSKKKYNPEFSNSEIIELNNVVSNMREIVKTALLII